MLIYVSLKVVVTWYDAKGDFVSCQLISNQVVMSLPKVELLTIPALTTNDVSCDCHKIGSFLDNQIVNKVNSFFVHCLLTCLTKVEVS